LHDKRDRQIGKLSKFITRFIILSLGLDLYSIINNKAASI